MRVLQVLPALESGGVERGTIEFAAELVRRGHESFVLSSGGSLTRLLDAQGSTHITMPVHRKSPASFGQIRPVRALLQQLQPDIIHVRSRMPAWITWLAWRGLPKDRRPALVSTFHGMYSVNPYSAIMARADRIIAVSECVKAYILQNYKVPPNHLSVIQRGVDAAAFHTSAPDPAWRSRLYQQYPHLQNKRIVLMPGRISRWKGQLLFIDAMADIIRQNPQFHGVVVGGTEAGKRHFMKELEQHRSELALDQHVTFLGQRSDMAELYRLATLVCHMSTKPEPFGRTVTEALAAGTPVVAFDRGGAAETLKACFPQGLVAPDDIRAFVNRVLTLADQPTHSIELPERFHLEAQTEATLQVYQQLLAAQHHSRP
ncbi:glycosyltransferase family 4 protein [Marinobacter zhejiangensis]|uniref:Glycosyltransferase involved in cell wall bisynthesis n=1 Tax=Marinobacter zhejiangensis TaxID=488535 RepID=A0A1I4SBW8_9GAMM|nr:glycosyltransferase family 4 protein [Marinobacter zhejiangensis]SFM61955.1 Glycosyltransferase involved in cell wall bisynthesis [Marinobacter zhejiangensis]